MNRNHVEQQSPRSHPRRVAPSRRKARRRVAKKAVTATPEQIAPESWLRVLLVEDDSAYAEFANAMLQGTSSVRVTLDCVPLLRNAVDRLAEHSYDIALVDLNLPDARELEALTTLVAVAPELPLVILGSMGNEKPALMR
jgi:CheY-like chemotaxis protein